MISILKETALEKDICDVTEMADGVLRIVLHDDADVQRIMKTVTDIDAQFWNVREPVSAIYVYQDGRAADPVTP